MKLFKNIYNFFVHKIEKDFQIISGKSYINELFTLFVSEFILLVILLGSFIIIVSSKDGYQDLNPISLGLFSTIYVLVTINNLVKSYFLLSNRFISLGYEKINANIFFIPYLGVFIALFQGKFKLALIYLLFFPIFWKYFAIENLKGKYKKGKKEILLKYHKLSFEQMKTQGKYNKFQIDDLIRKETISLKAQIKNDFVERRLEKKKYNIKIDEYDYEVSKLEKIAEYLIN